jgi:hypothetical protein
MSNFIENSLKFLETDFEADGIPVLIGAVQILQKQGVNVASIAAAKLYILGNAPAALLSAEQQFAQQELAALSTTLSTIKPPA